MIKTFWKFLKISPNGPLFRGVNKEFIFSKIAGSAAQWAPQVEDSGLPEILDNDDDNDDDDDDDDQQFVLVPTTTLELEVFRSV